MKMDVRTYFVCFAFITISAIAIKHEVWWIAVYFFGLMILIGIKEITDQIKKLKKEGT